MATKIAIEIATGDYIKDNDKAVKVIGYSVEDANENKYTLDYIQPNIIIRDKILECCGFVKNNDKYEFQYSNGNSSYKILVSKSQLSYRCDIYSSANLQPVTTKDNITVLSVLQDFIRQSTQGGELKVDLQRLSKEVAKKNY